VIPFDKILREQFERQRPEGEPLRIEIRTHLRKQEVRVTLLTPASKISRHLSLVDLEQLNYPETYLAHLVGTMLAEE